MPELSVIIPAAGRSERFGSNKLMQRIGEVPVLVLALRAFVQRDDVREVILPARQSPERASMLEQWSLRDRVRLCEGGACRAESVRNGLRLVSRDVEWVAVHDAARPMVSQELIDRTFAAAQAHVAAAPALAVGATVKQAGTSLPARVVRTLPRRELWLLQTPQIMRHDVLVDAFERCPIPLAEVTDDLQLLELAGQETWLVPGDEHNIKITTPLDLKLAEQWSIFLS